MRKVLLSTAAVLFAAACSDSSTGSSVPTSVAVTAAAPTLNAVGATTVVRATVSDQKGRAVSGAPLVWTASGTAVTVVAAGGDSAVVTAVSNGSATVTATSGSASGGATVQVAQVASSVFKAGGDNESGLIGAVLGSQVRVQVLDRLSAPVAGQSVTFAVTSGGGTITPTTSVTGADGIAAATWTLGPVAGSNTVVASFPGSSIAPVTFTAVGSTTVTTRVTVASGANQAAMINTAIPNPLSVVVTDASNLGVAGRTVTFSVRSGGGTLTGATAVTNASGIATLGGWTLGPVSGPQEVIATVAGTGATPAVFRGVGCEGSAPGTPGYGITLCFTSPMTSSQAQVFRTAAARWSSVITGDLSDLTFPVAPNDCDEGSPAMNMTYDDLLILAVVEPIDGKGRILGQAGPCYSRTSNGLPVVGLMRFDAADVDELELDGGLGAVFLHEMGHVIGVGSRWSSKGLLQNPSNATSALDTYYTGAGGIAGFDLIGGTAYSGLKVPVENTGGSGTYNSHWRESVLRNELMTGYLNNGSNPLSQLTVRSLADLGYTVNPAAADNFFLTLSLQAQPGGSTSVSAGTITMHDDVWNGPQFTVDRSGRKTRIR